MAEIKKMTYEEAQQVLEDIRKAKANGTTMPDAELAEKLAAALDVVKTKQTELDDDKAKFEKQVEEAKKQDPIFQAGFRGGRSYSPAQQSYRQLIRKGSGARDEFTKRFQYWNDDVMLASIVLEKSPEQVLKSIPELAEFMSIELKSSESELAKALAAATAGSGAEWIPEIFSPELIDLIRTERNLPPAFRNFPMASGTVNLNQLTQEFSAFVVAESTGNTPYAVPAIVSDFGTDRVILVAVEMAVASIFSKTFEEDSIVPALPEIRRRLVEGMSKGWEDAIINGSIESPHPDSDVIAGAPGTAWNGLRAEAQGQDFSDTLLSEDLSGTGMTVDNLLSLIRKQGRFGANPNDNVWLTSPQGLTKLMGLRDAVGTQILLPMDKFGDRAILLRGQIGMLMGSPVMSSDLVKTNLNSDGVVPQTPEDRTELIRFNREAFLIGDRRSLIIEQDVAPLTRQRIMVATTRSIFQRVKPSQDSKDNPVTVGLNIETA